MTVYGTAEPERVEAMGKKHNIVARPANLQAPPQTFWQANPHLLPTAAAGLLIAGGWAGEYAGAELLSIALFLVAIVVAGHRVGRRGIRSLLRLDFSMDALMTVAVVGAALIGEWSEGAVVAFLFSVSEFLESYTMDRARRSLRALMEIAPKVARIRRDGAESEMSVEDVRVGDTLIVRPGEKIAMDGRVAAGASAVNQAAITGESLPAEKGHGDEVFAGTVNGHGGLEVTVTRLVEDSTFARIVHLVEEAQAQRAPSQTFIERFARVYTPVVMGLAALIIIVPPLLMGAEWQPWIYRGLALLVVSCPCALVVSTPVSVVAAISNAARNGVLIKGGAHLERAGSIRAVAFDKTGTLTHGEPQVTDVAPVSGAPSRNELLCLAAAVEERSEHPLARAIVAGATCGHASHGARDFQAIVGRGAKATVDGRTVYVGSARFFQEELGFSLGETAPLLERWQSEGKTAMLVGDEKAVLGAIAVADALRKESPELVRQLKAAGVERTVMLTGDNRTTAQAIGRRAGVDEVQAELLPEQKVAAVRSLADRHGTTAMVGDGVNDAPALAAAGVGIAMGGAGTDVALETADIALMGDDLSKLPFTIRLSRATLGIIKQNIGIALVLKALAVAAVFPGWLTLWLAVLADTGATVIVTLNGMRLLRVKP